MAFLALIEARWNLRVEKVWRGNLGLLLLYGEHYWLKTKHYIEWRDFSGAKLMACSTQGSWLANLVGSASQRILILVSTCWLALYV